MNPNLEHLVRLQELDLAAEQIRRQMAELPARIAEGRARLTAHTEALEAARERLSESQTARRSIEKDLARDQSLLSKFKSQLMEVKTNKEYQAVQKEIATAEGEVQRLEDRVLEHMLEADELAAAVEKQEQELAAERHTVAQEEAELKAEQTALEGEIARLSKDRDLVGTKLAGDVRALYEEIARSRRGVAVIDVRNGHCGSCHVRLRPQVYNKLRQNDSLIRCESCQRILYFQSTPMVDEPA